MSKQPRLVLSLAPRSAKRKQPAQGLNLRRFYLQRTVDESGISGTGVVAEGVVYSSGWVAVRWRTATPGLTFFPSIEDLIGVHGHQGKTEVVFLDS